MTEKWLDKYKFIWCLLSYRLKKLSSLTKVTQFENCSHGFMGQSLLSIITNDMRTFDVSPLSLFFKKCHLSTAVWDLLMCCCSFYEIILQWKQILKSNKSGYFKIANFLFFFLMTFFSISKKKFPIAMFKKAPIGFIIVLILTAWHLQPKHMFQTISSTYVISKTNFFRYLMFFCCFLLYKLLQSSYSRLFSDW